MNTIQISHIILTYNMNPQTRHINSFFDTSYFIKNENILKQDLTLLKSTQFQTKFEKYTIYINPQIAKRENIINDFLKRSEQQHQYYKQYCITYYGHDRIPLSDSLINTINNIILSNTS